MADTLGLLQLPALATDNPVGDPTLGILVSFFAQCLKNNLGTAWAKVEPGQNVVTATDIRDPRADGLTMNELPGLFIARAGSGETVWRASDYPCIPTKLMLWWVLPRLQVGSRRTRAPIVNAARGALEFTTEWVARTQGWIVDGDTDARASTLGSLVTKYAGLWYLHWKKSELIKIPLSMATGPKQLFDAVVWTMEIGERLKPDPNGSRTYPNQGMTDSVADDGLVVIPEIEVSYPPLTGQLGTPNSMLGYVEPGVV